MLRIGLASASRSPGGGQVYQLLSGTFDAEGVPDTQDGPPPCPALVTILLRILEASPERGHRRDCRASDHFSKFTVTFCCFRC